MASYDLHREDIDERAFFPRLVLGEYLSAQFEEPVDRARRSGVEVRVRTQTIVKDVLIAGEDIKLTVQDSHQRETIDLFDYVILATGHQWPADPEVRPGYFTSPWPAQALSRIGNCAVGIRGTALSAINAAVALANNHGDFVDVGERLEYRPKPGTDDFTMTMFSRKGILPEADFYHPIPYEPLAVCNLEAIENLIGTGASQNLLNEAFRLLCHELTLADAAYAQALHHDTASLDEFCAAYFQQRCEADPFKWADANLAESEANTERKITVKWRYAILRMHEVFGVLAPHLSDADYKRFNDTLKPVFLDNYATVPHDSIRRLLALHAADKLVVQQLEDHARLNSGSGQRGATLISGKDRVHFPAFVEATGQKVACEKDFPFSSLLRQGVIQDVPVDDKTGPTRGVAIDGAFHPISAFHSSHRLFCLSLPFLLGQHPFAQGITSSAEMADVVADAIEAAENRLVADAPSPMDSRSIGPPSAGPTRADFLLGAAICLQP